MIEEHFRELTTYKRIQGDSTKQASLMNWSVTYGKRCAEKNMSPGLVGHSGSEKPICSKQNKATSKEKNYKTNENF